MLCYVMLENELPLIEDRRQTLASGFIAGTAPVGTAQS